MKLRLITTAILSSLISITASAQNGAYTGNIKTNGISLRIVFHFTGEGCTMDSPDQGIKGIKAEWKREENGDVNISIPSINGKYNGKFDGKSISGKFTQHGVSFPMDLKAGEGKLNRPQTPTGPFSYKTEEVTFTNGDAVLKGTLVLPENYNKNTPVFVMVTGSGLQNRDEEMFEHKPFAVIADALAKNGIATMRYDDRGFAESTGDVVNCTTEDLKNDALAGVKLMRKRFSKVGIIGHSEGGTIGLMLAIDKQVDYVISLAGAISSTKEMMIKQNRYALTASMVPKDMSDKYCAALEVAYDDLVAGKDVSVISSDNVPPLLRNNFETAMRQYATPYMRYFLSIDISKDINKVKCPVLGMNGKMDTQVDWESNLNVLLQSKLNRKSQISAYEGLNHCFQHCRTGAFTEYREIEETISPEVLDDMVKWIKKL